MQKKTLAKIILSSLVLMHVCLLTCFIDTKTTLAASGYEPFDGDGWSITADGVMTIENNQGWWNAMKHDYEQHVYKLVIGRDLTSFRVYSLPYDVPSPDFFTEADVSSYDNKGRPFYDDFLRSTDIFPDEIEVEEGNPVFRVIDGVLINTKTGELVLSYMCLKNAVVPEGVKTITRQAFFKRGITSVQFPKSLEVIGESAFARCEGLTSIELPDSLVELQLICPRFMVQEQC